MPRYWPSLTRLPLACCAIVILLSLSLRRDYCQAAGSVPQDPWAVDSFSGKGRGFVPEVCGPLTYFSESPLPFDFGQDLFQMPQTSFTYNTNPSLIGTVRGHRIFQIVQQVHPRPAAASPWWGDLLDMKRILVERHANQFCMIFEEQGPVGSTGMLFRIDPAELVTIDGEFVLITHDRVTGNGGYYIDGAWAFDDGVPVSLNQANDEIERALKTVLPSGCTIDRGDPLDLKNLTYKSELWKPGDNMAEPTCGSVVLKLSIQSHRIVVVSKQYIP
jgi:hypothetical protein